MTSRPLLPQRRSALMMGGGREGPGRVSFRVYRDLASKVHAIAEWAEGMADASASGGIRALKAEAF